MTVAQRKDSVESGKAYNETKAELEKRRRQFRAIFQVALSNSGDIVPLLPAFWNRLLRIQQKPYVQSG